MCPLMTYYILNISGSYIILYKKIIKYFKIVDLTINFFNELIGLTSDFLLKYIKRWLVDTKIT